MDTPAGVTAASDRRVPTSTANASSSSGRRLPSCEARSRSRRASSSNAIRSDGRHASRHAAADSEHASDEKSEAHRDRPGRQCSRHATPTTAATAATMSSATPSGREAQEGAGPEPSRRSDRWPGSQRRRARRQRCNERRRISRDGLGVTKLLFDKDFQCSSGMAMRHASQKLRPVRNCLRQFLQSPGGERDCHRGRAAPPLLPFSASV